MSWFSCRCLATRTLNDSTAIKQAEKNSCDVLRMWVCFSLPSDLAGGRAARARCSKKKDCWKVGKRFFCLLELPNVKWSFNGRFWFYSKTCSHDFTNSILVSFLYVLHDQFCAHIMHHLVHIIHMLGVFVLVSVLCFLSRGGRPVVVFVVSLPDPSFAPPDEAPRMAWARSLIRWCRV